MSEVNLPEWASTTFDPGYAEELCTRILEGSSTEGDCQPFYTMNQVVKVFQMGYALGLGQKERITEQIQKDLKLPKKKYVGYIRQLNVGEAILFPYECWGSVRSITSTLRKVYGTVFVTHKIGAKNEKGGIKVLRIK